MLWWSARAQRASETPLPVESVTPNPKKSFEYACTRKSKCQRTAFSESSVSAAISVSVCAATSVSLSLSLSLSRPLTHAHPARREEAASARSETTGATACLSRHDRTKAPSSNQPHVHSDSCRTPPVEHVCVCVCVCVCVYVCGMAHFGTHIVSSYMQIGHTHTHTQARARARARVCTHTHRHVTHANAPKHARTFALARAHIPTHPPPSPLPIRPPR